MTMHQPPESGRRRAGVSILALTLVAPLLAVLAWVGPASGADLTATLVRTTNLGALDPPIPDPSGLTYIPSRDRLLISDGEVDEMPIFQGSNLFETTRTGVIQDRGVSTPQTHEPVGVSYQPGNNHLLVVDDDQQRVHDFAPGADDRFGTADDVRTFFSTAAFGSTDPEDVLFYPPTGEIFVLEGSDNDVHRLAPGANGVFDGVPPVGDDTAVEFDTLNFGADDPEGITYHPTRGALLIVDFQTNRVYELNRELMLINVIDISASHQLKAAAIVVAPATDDPSRSDLYIVDRGIDNDTDPNEKDGKLYEMSVQLPAIPNLAPIASAGRDTATHVAEPATLGGSIRDDGKPQLAAVSAAWSKVSGPGTVSFAAAFSPQTAVTFSAAGTYRLRLTADDSALSGSDDVTVQVAEPGAPLSFAIPVAKAFDDVEEPPSGWVDWLSSSLNLPNAGGVTAQTVALRFTGLDVPRGATITSASIQFTSKSARSGATSMQVRAVAADNTPTFAMAPGNVSARPRTTASVTWSPPAWGGSGEAGAAERSADLRTVVQEVTNRAGWTRGNALAFVLTGTGERVAQSQESGGIAPVLHLAYKTSDTPPPTGQIGFRGGAHFIGNTTSASVTVPPSVQPGDALILAMTMNAAAAALTAPAGWTQLADVTISTARTLVWRRVAAPGDAGGSITVESSAIAKFAVQLAAYSGTSTTNPVAAFTSNTEPASLTSHATPSVTVGSPGSWLVSYWADKSSATTDWTASAGVVVRDEAIGTGGGRITALLGDSGGPVPTGTAGGRTATTDAASRAATVSIVLAAA